MFPKKLFPLVTVGPGLLSSPHFYTKFPIAPGTQGHGAQLWGNGGGVYYGGAVGPDISYQRQRGSCSCHNENQNKPVRNHWRGRVSLVSFLQRTES